MKKIKVAIVEDCKDICNLIASYIQVRFSDSIEITGLAYDGLTGLNLLNTQKPDVAIIDLIMPEMNGLELLSSLRSHQETELIKCIIISNTDNEGVALKAKSLGAERYIMKPFEFETLCSDIVQLGMFEATN